MNQKTIPDNAVDLVAQHINERSNKNYSIPVIWNPDNPETPQIFEIIPFDKIDKTDINFSAIDGSHNSQQFYNGVSIGIYNAGYICYKGGKQIRMNDMDDPIILGKAYYPQNILIINEEHLLAIYDELLNLEPIKNTIEFFHDSTDNIFPYKKDVVCSNLSTLLSFAQEVLEWSLVYEIANRSETRQGDFILRDGTLRSLNIKQKYLVELGKFLHRVSPTRHIQLGTALKLCHNLPGRNILKYQPRLLQYNRHQLFAGHHKEQSPNPDYRLSASRYLHLMKALKSNNILQCHRKWTQYKLPQHILRRLSAGWTLNNPTALPHRIAAI
jgi:hypothetical protein